jgi:hypothetical protein
MRLALCAVGLAMAVSGVARADDTSGEIQVDALRVANVRSLSAALADAQQNAGDVRIAQFLAVLPLTAADSARLDAAYPQGLHAGCEAGDCTIDGTGAAARATLDTTDPNMKGVDVGLKEAIAGAFKVVDDANGRTVSVCGVSGVYFARLIFRKNLINFQFVDAGGDHITARYELQGATPTIHCD